MVLRPRELHVSEERVEVVKQSVQTDTNVKTLIGVANQIGPESGPCVPSDGVPMLKKNPHPTSNRH